MRNYEFNPNIIICVVRRCWWCYFSEFLVTAVIFSISSLESNLEYFIWPKISFCGIRHIWLSEFVNCVVFCQATQICSIHEFVQPNETWTRAHTQNTEDIYVHEIKIRDLFPKMHLSFEDIQYLCTCFNPNYERKKNLVKWKKSTRMWNKYQKCLEKWKNE